MTIAVVIPAFNEASKIGHLLDEIPANLGSHEVSVVVVDDGSTDGTGAIARGHGAVILEQTPNQGKGAALTLGMEFVRNMNTEAVVWMDGDGQHVPASLPSLIAPILSQKADLCVGSRYLEARQHSKAPLNRRLVRRATIRAVERLTGYEVTDPFSGYRSFSRDAVDMVRLDGCGYECELESTFAVARAGLRYTEVAIPRIYGPDTSKMAHRGRLQVLSGYARTIRRAGKQRGTNREAQLVA